MDDALVTAARSARTHAYCPYSGFAVGAALETDDGRVFTGCNVENASYALTVCAERAAVLAAVAAGVRRFRRLVVVAEADPPVSPCGACRQVMSELLADNALIISCHSETEYRSWSIAELLPYPFLLS